MSKKLLLPLLLCILNPLLAADKEDRLSAMAVKIDSLVQQKLTEKGLSPKAIVNDEIFVRRAYLDLLGRIPTYNEITAFLKDESRSKRIELVDKLASQPGYTSHNFNYWADVLRAVNRMRNVSGDNYISFIKDAIRKDMPYDKFVHKLLTADGAAYAHGNGATGYYLRDAGMPLDNMSNSMQIFLGTSMVCAQCHDHPFSDWTQMDFYKLAAFTSGINTRGNYNSKDPKYQPLRELRKESRSDQDLNRAFKQVSDVLFAQVDNGGTGMIRLPHDYDYDDAKPYGIVKAETPYGPQVNLEFVEQKLSKKDQERMNRMMKSKNKKRLPTPGKDINSRNGFADWVTSRQNPMFTKVIVNRMWEKIMGAPLCGPVMNLTLESTGPNRELLAELNKQMQQLNFSLKDFTRVLMRTKLYQRQSQEDVTDDVKSYFAGPVLKRLSAEQLWDSLLALAVDKPDANLPLKSVISSRELLYENLKNKNGEELVKIINEAKGDKKYFKKYAQEAEGMNMSMEMNMAMATVTSSQKKRDKYRKKFEELKKEIRKAQKKKDKDKLKELYAKMNEMRQSYKNTEDEARIARNKTRKDFRRASEVGSPAPASHFLRRFGQSDRQIIDGASTEASVPQALTLLNGKVEDYLTLNTVSAINRNIAAAKTHQDKVKTAFLSILNRFPESDELTLFTKRFEEDPEQARKDMVWVLVNSNEFLFRQ